VAGVIYFDASADWTIPVDGPGWTAWTTAMAATPVADAQLDAIFLPHFWDVPYSTPEFPEIQALGDFGVTTGCGTAPPRFCPDDRLSRRDAAIWLARAFRLTISDSFPLYSDVLPDDPAFMEIQALAVAGFTMGCGGGRFCPDDDMTGGDFATMLLSIGAPVGAGVDRPLTRTEAAVILAPAAHIAPRPL
jgi:hypothetical protein